MSPDQAGTAPVTQAPLRHRDPGEVILVLHKTSHGHLGRDLPVRRDEYDSLMEGSRSSFTRDWVERNVIAPLLKDERRIRLYPDADNPSLISVRMLAAVEAAIPTYDLSCKQPWYRFLQHSAMVGLWCTYKPGTTEPSHANGLPGQEQVKSIRAALLAEDPRLDKIFYRHQIEMADSGVVAKELGIPAAKVVSELHRVQRIARQGSLAEPVEFGSRWKKEAVGKVEDAELRSYLDRFNSTNRLDNIDSLASLRKDPTRFVTAVISELGGKISERFTHYFPEADQRLVRFKLRMAAHTAVLDYDPAAESLASHLIDRMLTGLWAVPDTGRTATQIARDHAASGMVPGRSEAQEIQRVFGTLADRYVRAEKLAETFERFFLKGGTGTELATAAQCTDLTAYHRIQRIAVMLQEVVTGAVTPTALLSAETASNWRVKREGASGDGEYLDEEVRGRGLGQGVCFPEPIRLAVLLAQIDESPRLGPHSDHDKQEIMTLLQERLIDPMTKDQYSAFLSDSTNREVILYLVEPLLQKQAGILRRDHRIQSTGMMDGEELSLALDFAEKALRTYNPEKHKEDGSHYTLSQWIYNQFGNRALDWSIANSSLPKTVLQFGQYLDDAMADASAALNKPVTLERCSVAEVLPHFNARLERQRQSSEAADRDTIYAAWTEDDLSDLITRLNGRSKGATSLIGAEAWAENPDVSESQILTEIDAAQEGFGSVARFRASKHADQLADAASQLLDLLPPKEREVIKQYYLHERTLREVGEAMDSPVSESRACQLHGDGIERIKGILRSSGIKSVAELIES